MNPPAPSSLFGRFHSFALFRANDPFATPDPAADAPTADEILESKLCDHRYPFVPVTCAPGSDPRFVYFIPDIARGEAKSLADETGGHRFVFGRIRDRGDLVLEYHLRRDAPAAPRAAGKAPTVPSPQPPIASFSIRYPGFRIDIPADALATAADAAARLPPVSRPLAWTPTEWRWPDYRARAALVRNLDFVLSRPDIAAAPLPGARHEPGEVGPYGEILTLGAFARYNRNRVRKCPDCGARTLASDGISTFCASCGSRTAAFVYTGGGGVFSRQGAHHGHGCRVREAVARDPGVAPAPDAAARMLPGGLDPNGIAGVFHGRLRDAYAQLALDEIAEHDDGVPRPSSPYPRGMGAARAAALLLRAAPFVLARPDIAAAPAPAGIGPGETLGAVARALCPDLPIEPDKERTLPDGIRPADLANVFGGRLVDAYVRIALDTLDRLDRAAAAAIREGRSFHATFRMRAPDGAHFETVFANIGGWAMLFDGEDRPLGHGVRVAWDPATGIAPTLRASVRAVAAGGATAPGD